MEEGKPSGKTLAVPRVIGYPVIIEDAIGA